MLPDSLVGCSDGQTDMAFNSDFFQLSNWKLTLPTDASGGTGGIAKEIKNLIGYEGKGSFYDAADGAMVFRADTDGATTVGTTYARSELREMNGKKEANWTLSEGGRMSATLKVDSVPTLDDGSLGRICIGQIHGEDQELVRLYWENGTVYFVNDIAGSDGRERTFSFGNLTGGTPSIELGETFSYVIDASGDKLSIDIYADGELYSSFSRINPAWQSDQFYFKAGVYLGVNEKSGEGTGQASFYGLDVGHTAADGFDGIKDRGHMPEDRANLPPASDLFEGDSAVHPGLPIGGIKGVLGTARSDVVSGSSASDTIFGLQGDDTVKGRQGNDTIFGGAGNDYIEGNEGNDVLIGGSGADRLKGSAGADTFVIRSIAEAGDTIIDWKAASKLDLTGIFLPSGISSAAEAFEAGALELRQNGGTVEVWAYPQSGAVKLASLLDTKVGQVSANQIVLDSDARYAADGFVYSDAKVSGKTELVADAPVNADNGTPAEDVAEIPAATASFADAARNVGASLADPESNTGEARGQDYAGVANLVGSRYADRLEGDDAANVITGGKGADHLIGGRGADIFKFLSSGDTGTGSSNRDVIEDFAPGEDVIDLSGIDTNGAASGDGSFHFNAREGAKFDGSFGSLIFDHIDKSGSSSDRTVLLADVDGDRLVDFQIELTGIVPLTTADLVL